MDLKLFRKTFTDRTTISDFTIDGKFQCYFLEDKDRGLTTEMSLEGIEKVKVYGKTCIPYGRYEVQITYSNKFKIHYPILIAVPGYSGIRIHAGVNEFHTLGCLLPGNRKGVDKISDSKTAFYKIFEKMLVHKTDSDTAKKLIELHKFNNAAQFAGMYSRCFNSNKIFITIEK